MSNRRWEDLHTWSSAWGTSFPFEWRWSNMGNQPISIEEKLQASCTRRIQVKLQREACLYRFNKPSRSRHPQLNFLGFLREECCPLSTEPSAYLEKCKLWSWLTISRLCGSIFSNGSTQQPTTVKLYLSCNVTGIPLFAQSNASCLFSPGK